MGAPPQRQQRDARRAAEEPPSASTPVAHTERMQRLQARTQDRRPELETPKERLKRMTQSLDAWSETRTRKTLWQSWTCAHLLAVLTHRQRSARARACS